MRLAFLLVLGLLPVLSGEPAHAGFTTVSYTLSIGTLSLDVGEEGAVELRLTNIQGGRLGAWTVDVTYDPEVVSLKTCGPRENGACDADRAVNMIRVIGASATGLAADTVLATITFQCESEGESPLSVTAVGGIGIPEIIERVETRDGSVACQAPPELSPTALPTPTAMLGISLPQTGAGGGARRGGLGWLVAVTVGAGLAAVAAFGGVRARRRRV